MICEAILHFDPLRTQIKTEIIDQNDIHRVKYIESDEIMRMIRALSRILCKPRIRCKTE